VSDQGRLEERGEFFEKNGQYLDAQRIRADQFDLEMCRNGILHGIETTSRHLNDARPLPPLRPDRFLPDDFLLMNRRKSTPTVPQSAACTRRPRAQADGLVELGFRLRVRARQSPTELCRGSSKSPARRCLFPSTPREFEIKQSTWWRSSWCDPRDSWILIPCIRPKARVDHLSGEIRRAVDAGLTRARDDPHELRRRISQLSALSQDSPCILHFLHRCD